MAQYPRERLTPESVPDQEKPCDVHGAYMAKHLFGNHWMRCPGCERDSEVRRAELQAKQDQREKAERAATALSVHLRHSGLIGRFKAATLDTFIAKTPEQKAVVTACRNFVESFDPRGGGGLWLIGAPGTGKTHIGSAMVSHIIRDRGMGAAIHGVHEIMAMLRARWGVREAKAWDDDGISTTDDLLAHLGRIPLLVLDEIGVTRGTDDELKQLFCIVDERYRLERPTILLSNLGPAEMKPVLGERSYDRLREGSRMLVCNWESHRGQIK